MATLHHNISGTTTVELLAPGDNQNVSKISICNINESYGVSIDLYIRKVGTGKFSLMHAFSIPACTTYVYDGVFFNNSEGEFGLYIQCGGTSPTIDVIIG